METSTYEVFFSANGFTGVGWGQSNGAEIMGGDKAYKFAGHFDEEQGLLLGTMAISVDRRIVADSAVDKNFSLKMSGPRTSAGFSLIGTGPLGLIVQIDAVRQRQEAVAARAGPVTPTDAIALERRVAAFIAVSHAYIDAAFTPHAPNDVAIALVAFKTELRELRPLLPPDLAQRASAFYERSLELPNGLGVLPDQSEREDAWAEQGDELFALLLTLLASRTLACNSERF